MSSVRGPGDPASLRRLCEILMQEAEHIERASLVYVRGVDYRLAFEGPDRQRSIRLPGILQEDDEKDDFGATEPE